MVTRIGIIAGEIWHLLEKRDKVSVDDILESIDSSKELIFMSIGWLAREGHIVLEGETPNHMVSLRKE